MTLTPTPVWHQWIGLPHRIGADPTEGEAACCLHMAAHLLRHAGEEPFEINPVWYDWAATENWDRIKQEFLSLTYPCPPRPWALIPFWEPFGLGVLLPNDLVLVPHHHRGVTAIPVRALINPTFYRVLPALVS